MILSVEYRAIAFFAFVYLLNFYVKTFILVEHRSECIHVEQINANLKVGYIRTGRLQVNVCCDNLEATVIVVDNNAFDLLHVCDVLEDVGHGLAVALKVVDILNQCLTVGDEADAVHIDFTAIYADLGKFDG